MDNKNVIQLIDTLILLFDPVVQATDDPQFASGLFRELGYNPSVPVTIFSDFVPALEALADLLHETDEDMKTGISSDHLELLKNIVQGIKPIIEIINNTGAPIQKNFSADFLTGTEIVEKFPRQLFDYLIIRMLERKFSVLYGVLLTGGIIDECMINQAATPFHVPHTKRTVLWEKIPDIFSNPLLLLKSTYQWGTDGFMFSKLIMNIKKFGQAFNLYTEITSADPDPLSAFHTGTDVVTTENAYDLEILKAPLLSLMANPVGFEIYPVLNSIKEKTTGIGLGVYFDPASGLEFPITDNLKLKIKHTGSNKLDAGLIIQKDQPVQTVSNVFGSGGSDGLENFVPEFIYESDDDEKTLIFDTSFGVKLQFQNWAVRGGVREGAIFIETDIKGLALTLSSDGGDSFLQKILPSTPLKVDFDLTVGFSTKSGIYFRGGTSSGIQLPVHIKAGAVALERLIIAIEPGDRKVVVALGGDIKTSLGPLQAVVQNMGAMTTLSLPQDNKGNLGPVNLGLDFKFPSGIGITISTKDITGGGLLELNQERGEYTGMVQLSFRNKISLKAFGIIQTKPTYSFLIIVSAEFPAIQLGLGFSLTGVGGLIGIHRRIELQKIQEGIIRNDIDDILFPKDPLKSAHALLNKINQFFPPAENQYTFGLMAQLAWGPKNVVTIELGLIMEFPEPVRIVILGVLRAQINKKLGSKEIKVLKLQVNFVAAFDFDKQFIRLDASLVDSTLLGMKLEGDMALRIKYGSNADFALTIGGFHPRFEPPALDLPAKMRRLQIVLRSGNPNITVQCYLALTSNTIQFGVAGLFVFKKWGVGIRGELSFDALFQFVPFRFETDVHFLLAASWKGHDFAAIEVDGTFAGPSPWRIKGKLRLKFWIFSKTVSLDESWGDKDQTQLETIRVLPLLADDLRNMSNWERSPGSTHLSVMLRKRLQQDAAGTLTLHPTELITVRQSTVPLGQKIDWFAGRRPQGANTFSIALKKQDQSSIPASKTVSNHFATAQFFEMSDEEKLSTPSYQLFNAGSGFEGLDAVVCDAFASVKVIYETDTVDATTGETLRGTYRESRQHFEYALANNAIANAAYAPVSRKRTAVTSISEKYVIVDQDTLRAIEAPAADNEVEAWQLLREMKVQDVFDRLHLTVLPVSESMMS